MRSCISRRSGWATFVLACHLVSAQALTRDINESDGSRSSSPTGFAVLNGVMYFAATDATHGNELWRTDGTRAGTTMVLDGYAGVNGATPRNLLAVGNQLFFSASDGFSGEELWVSDGTPAGTRMVRDLNPGANGSGLTMFTAVGGVLLFVAAVSAPSATGRELWRSDGTPGGTVLVKDIRPGVGDGIPNVSALRAAVVGGLCVFPGDDGVHGFEPWVSDGTSAGTQLLLDIRPGISGSTVGYNMLATGVGDFACFVASASTTGEELWRTDGTAANTRLVADFFPGVASAAPTNLMAWNGRLVFAANTSTMGNELCVSDGTAAGTGVVRDIFPGASSSQPGQFCVVGNDLYLVAADSAGRELWRSDGTSAGTYRVADLLPGPSAGTYAELIAFAGRLAFTYTYPTNPRGIELWTSDGSVNGTTLLRDIVEGSYSSSPTMLGTYAGRLWFAATEPTRGRELWTTDGSAAGTALFLNINTSATTSASTPSALTALADRCLFFADDGVHGRELWRSDGTAAGTVLVHDIDARPAGAGIANDAEIAVLGARVVFPATDNVTGVELWASDGTAAGTSQVADIFTGAGPSNPRGFQTAGGRTFFFARSSLGRELWVTDGTASGTRLVRDVLVGAGDGGGDVGFGLSDLLVVDDTVWFQGNDGVRGAELWKSDGTAAGTVLVKDLVPGSASGRPMRMCRFGSLLVFVASDGFTPVLWRSDGTEAGTYPIFLDGVVAQAGIPIGVEYGGRFFFAGPTGFQQSPKLYATDGTLQGTVMVFDSLSGRLGAGVGVPTRIGDRLAFAAFEAATGNELYVSDGTTAGTALVSDVYPGFNNSSGVPNSGCFGGLTQAGSGRLAIYIGGDAVVGYEPWLTDLTMTGTVNVGDVFPGTVGGVANRSDPQWFTQVGEHVFFTADDGAHGRELFVVGLTQLGGAHVALTGRGCAGSGGRIATLRAVGAPTIANAAFGLRVADALSAAPCIVILGSALNLQIGGGCTLRAAVDVTFGGVTDNAGTFTLPLPLPNDRAFVGARVHTQAAVVDPQGAWQGVAAFSDGLALLLGR